MWQNLKTPFFTILFIFVGLALYIRFVGPLPFSVTSVTTTKESLFSVSGEGEVTAIPDTANLSLGVNKQATTVTAAQEQVNQIINQITNDLKGLGIPTEDIKTTNYSVYPTYNYNEGDQRITGYEVNATIEVQVTPIDKANQAIDLATKVGATQVGSVQFVLNDEEQKKLEKQARDEAIANAKEKAESISSSAGIRLGRIVNVQESVAKNQPPYPMFESMRAADSGVEEVPPTELNPGENKVTTTVTLFYETY